MCEGANLCRNRFVREDAQEAAEGRERGRARDRQKGERQGGQGVLRGNAARVSLLLLLLLLLLLERHCHGATSPRLEKDVWAGLSATTSGRQHTLSSKARQTHRGAAHHRRGRQHDVGGLPSRAKEKLSPTSLDPEEPPETDPTATGRRTLPLTTAAAGEPFRSRRPHPPTLRPS